MLDNVSRIIDALSLAFSLFEIQPMRRLFFMLLLLSVLFHASHLVPFFVLGTYLGLPPLALTVSRVLRML